MSTHEVTTVGTMAKGQSGTVVGGKFAGRPFRVLNHGTTGRTTMVEWLSFDTYTTGIIRSATTVEEH